MNVVPWLFAMNDSPSAPITFSMDVEPSVETLPPALPLSDAQPASIAAAVIAASTIIIIFFIFFISFRFLQIIFVYA